MPTRMLLTLQGFRKLSVKLDELKERLREVNQEEDSKEEAGFLCEQITRLTQALKTCEIITIPPENEHAKVCVGAKVIVETSGLLKELTIVGPLETNPVLGMISYESPVGAMLLDKKAGDIVTLSVNSGARSYTIREVKYEGIEERACANKESVLVTV